MKLQSITYSPEIIFDPEVIDILYTYKQNGDTPETGGILLGKVYKNGDIMVCRCSEPCVIGKANKMGFYRSFKIANKIINQAFQESNGTVLYLGEWHTHPVDNPIPSPTDKTSIENIYNTANLSVNVIIYLIIGRSSIYYGCYDGKKHYKLV